MYGGFENFSALLRAGVVDAVSPEYSDHFLVDVSKYIKAHPEFVQKMQKIARNAGNFSKQMNQMTAALSGYEAKMGKLAQDYANAQMREENHS